MRFLARVRRLVRLDTVQVPVSTRAARYPCRIGFWGESIVDRESAVNASFLKGQQADQRKVP